ncbi:class I SAM-dependent methyltransferase [Altererythrobacter sp. KTW20L]|uniref:class I SAM-dependent methyltransferase n=1 Tax=Altererythrobacter sp. KTW20L TaxID=2942210 RepID=UPI0020C15512|nr:class I SAM-dependent methyltransferase [Altererythrobacter sp. KTW20L]MCL6249751.1 class I SAM-dependent methyltransferase [Altererythrobacter sp. KTW20L]
MQMLRAPDETFGSHRIAAAPGTHAILAEIVSAKVEAKDSKILDMGAYTGALISRLRAHGYENLLAADLSNHLTEKVEKVWACDFNGDFPSVIAERDFDCIIASEVIEHLDDPRAFMRRCRSMLRPGGVLIISTPNIAFFEGRIKFALTGEIWAFGAKNYKSIRHITPISARHLPMMMAECGLRCDLVETGASYASTLRKILTAPIWLPMRLAFGESTLGETLFAVGIADVVSGNVGLESWESQTAAQA